MTLLEGCAAEVGDRRAPARLRRVFSAFPTGVAALAAEHGDVQVGMAASSFVSVSLDPPLVSVCVAVTSRTWVELRNAPRIGVSVLADGHAEASSRLSAREGDRFAGMRWRRSAERALFLADAAAWLECSLEQEIPAGDHHIALLRVHDLDIDPEAEPLVFHRSGYRRLAS
jgi:flavin reductase (DIM6/NTAB) family NADH-FMN oxidoreductase RutF